MNNAHVLDTLQTVRDCLKRIGYQDELLIPDYKFRNFMAEDKSSDNESLSIELAAFAQSPATYRSACIGVTITDDESPETILRLRSLGAPQVLAIYRHNGHINRWKMPASGLPEQKEPIGLENISDVFTAKEKEWSPTRVLEAKSIAQSSQSTQLDFTDLGLIPALEAELQSKLDRDLKRVLEVCEKAFLQHHSKSEYNNIAAELYRLLFRLIAAKLLIDGGIKPDWAKLDAQEVVREVERFYFSVESAPPALSDKDTQDAAWKTILDGLNLQNLSVETLAFIYENTLVTDELRKKQGIHATPPEIADYILRQLPLKELKIKERRVFEPFSGHAPFLISALGHMRTLLPKDVSPDERHEYFKEMLVGMENEPFACEIARYSLILADYPNHDGWRILQENVFTSPDFETKLQRANIILSNPPHEDFSPDERRNLPSGTLHNKAAEALRRVLKRQPPMFGFVLPRTFLDKAVFRSLRQEIVNKYRHVSVTILPDKTFKKASQEAALLIADNVGAQAKSYHYASVTSGEYETFLSSGEPTFREPYDAPINRNNDVILWRAPLLSVWEELSSFSKFGSMIDLHEGIRYKKGLVKNCILQEPHEDFVGGIAKRKGCFEHYIIADYQYLCNKPEVMYNNFYLLPWEQPKILVNRVRTSIGYWRIAGASDQEELRATRQFYGGWAKRNEPIELLAALVNSPIANAYMFDHSSGWDNDLDDIRQIPVPWFTDEQTELIVSLVQDYALQRGNWLVEPENAIRYERRCKELIYQIDAAVLEAYNLPAKLERLLLNAFNEAERYHLPFHFDGYGEEYERAKEALQEEKAYRALLKQYQSLVNKKYIASLTPAETEEMQRLGREIDKGDAPFYEPTLQALKSGQF